MKYNVTMEFLYHADVEVEADSVDEAVMKVQEMNNKEIVGRDAINSNDLEDGEITYVYDENWKEVLSC